jgi:UDP-glucose 4-epimerase
MDIADKEVIFYGIDVTKAEAVDIIFRNYKIDGVIHFAGLQAVGESVEKPLEYYYNNIVVLRFLQRPVGNMV